MKLSLYGILGISVVLAGICFSKQSLAQATRLEGQTSQQTLTTKITSNHISSQQLDESKAVDDEQFSVSKNTGKVTTAKDDKRQERERRKRKKKRVASLF